MSEQGRGYQQMLAHAFLHDSTFANCLQPLLKALHWPGHERHLAQALPHFNESLHLGGFCRVLQELGYQSKHFSLRQDHLDSRLLPCILISGDEVYVLLDETAQGWRAFSGRLNKQVNLESLPSNALIYLFERKTSTGSQRDTWWNGLSQDFKALFMRLVFISLVTNLIMIATPLFIMSVYDSVIATGSYTLLATYLCGILIITMTSVLLYQVRYRTLAYFGAKLELTMGNHIVRQLLYLAPHYTESATVGSQMARIKDFDSVRNFFTSTLLSLIFDLPFVALFILAIALLSGHLVIIPVLAVALYAVAVCILHPMIKKMVSASAERSSECQSYLLEALNNVSVIKFSTAERPLFHRFRTLTAETSYAHFRASVLTSIINASADALVILTGLTFLYFGTLAVLDKHLSVGALIACMILIWRVLSPVRQVLVALTRFEQLRSGIRQIIQLMRITPEHEFNPDLAPINFLQGRVEFSRVSFRYHANKEPALLGVSFRVQAGEVVAVTGRNGSGKSTLVKMMIAMHFPQAGAIMIDGVDIRQFDPVELRHAIAYVSQNTQLFYGTIAQNLQFANPTADEAKMRWAAEKAGLLADISAMPEGFNTQLRDHNKNAFSSCFLQRLALTRAYLKEAKIYLFDEPGSALDNDADQYLQTAIQQLRHKATVFIVTHRPSHMQLADRILLLKEGQLMMNGPVNDVLPEVMRDYK